MGRYITTLIDPKECSVGGLGHVFQDILSGYYFAFIFNIEHAHYDWKTCEGNQRNQCVDPVVHWNKFFKLGQNEPKYSELKRTHKLIRINMVPQYNSLDLEDLKRIVEEEKGEDVIFCLTKNNRIYSNEVFVYESENKIKKGIYERVNDILRQSVDYDGNKGHNDKFEITVHVRRGDGRKESTVHGIKLLDQVLKLIKIKSGKISINVVSAGTLIEMKEIERVYQKYIKNYTVNFYLNTDTIESFKTLIRSHVLIMGDSSYPKLAGLINRNCIKLYLPIVTKEYLEKNKGTLLKNKLTVLTRRNHLGKCLEHYGYNWLMVADGNVFDEKEFEKLMNENFNHQNQFD